MHLFACIILTVNLYCWKWLGTRLTSVLNLIYHLLLRNKHWVIYIYKIYHNADVESIFMFVILNINILNQNNVITVRVLCPKMAQAGANE